MRPCWICACVSGLALTASFAVAAESNVPHAPVTIVLKFENPFSSRSIEEMKREFQRATRNSIPVEWRMRDQMANGGTTGDLVLVTFKGRCIMDSVPPPVYDESGPLAWTSAVDGAPLPFGQVSCDRVRNAVLRAMWGSDFSHGEQLYGRALGRVLAHEFYHMMAKSTAHAASGVTKPALSGPELIGSSLTMDPEAIEMMDRQ